MPGLEPASMAAALASPCRIRRNRRHLRRVASGRTVYGYVGGNPISRIDPLGLVEWTGTFHVRSFVIGTGAGHVSFDLTSECVDGKQSNAQVTMVGPGLGAGFKALIGADVQGSVTFNDWQNDLDPSRLEGLAGVFSAGVQVGPLGGGVTKFRLGDSFSQSVTNTRGLDVGASVLMGSSTITGGKGVTDCGCPK